MKKILLNGIIFSAAFATGPVCAGQKMSGRMDAPFMDTDSSDEDVLKIYLNGKKQNRDKDRRASLDDSIKKGDESAVLSFALFDERYNDCLLINSVNQNKETPLDVAVFNAEFKIAKILMAHGAESTNKDTLKILTSMQDPDFGANGPFIKKGRKLGSGKSLFLMIEHDDMANFKKCLSKKKLANGNHARLNALKNKQGKPLLHVALENNDGMAMVLMKKNIGFDSTDADGNTPLHIAVNEAEDSSIILWLSKKVNINAQNKYGETPLHNAHDDEALLLIEQGADTTIQDDGGNTPLHYLGKKCSTEFVRLYITRNNAVLSIKNNKGHTPLDEAIGSFKGGSCDGIKAMIAHGAKETEYIRTILKQTPYATIDEWLDYKSFEYDLDEGNIGQLRNYLSKAEGIIDFQSLSNTLVFSRLAMNEHAQEIIALMIKRGFDPNMRNITGATILHYACKNTDKELIEFLLELSDIQINSLNLNGKTPLDWLNNTPFGENLSLCKMMINKGALTSRELELVRAIDEGDLEILGQFLKHTYRIDFKNSIGIVSFDQLVCNCNVSNESFRTLQGLMHSGFEVDMCDRNGATLLHYACQYRKKELIRFLLNCDDVQINSLDKNGKTPLDRLTSWASDGSDDLYNVLIKKGALTKDQIKS